MIEPVGVSHREVIPYADAADGAYFNKISWGAIFAGIALALACEHIFDCQCNLVRRSRNLRILCGWICV